jgi:hypothetical protein
MPGMPDWFAKTPEMMALDKYFSLVDAKTPTELTRRYTAALAQIKTTDGYAGYSTAMNRHMTRAQVEASLAGHFEGDWVHHNYLRDPKAASQLGGLFWPSIPSTTVVHGLRRGMELAIHKALGDTQLAKLGYSQRYRHALFAQERAYGVELDRVLPMAMSWNCVAPTGSDFFDVAALRGPTIVEFAVATPQPYGVSMSKRLLSMVDYGVIATHEADEPKPRKTPARKAAAKKAPARKTAAKKTAAKKTAARKQATSR